MTAQKDRKKALREQRLARERALAKTRHRRRIVTIGLGAIVGLAVVVSLVLAIVHSASSPPSASASASNSAPTSQTAALPGIQATAPPWAPTYDGLPQRIAGLGFPPNGDESFHIHALLHVFVKGQAFPVAANVGVTRGIESPLHTHDTSGIIHIEAGQPFPFKLSDFFAIWGVKFSATQLGDLKNHGEDSVQVYVNGQKVNDGPGHVLAAHDNIVVAYGALGSFPTTPPADALAGL